MEEYLENMKSLRSYMNDLEDDAAKRSAEEQQQRTAIDAHDAEITLGSGADTLFISSVGDGTSVSLHRVTLPVLDPRWRFGTVMAQVKRAREEAEQLAEARVQVLVDMAEKQGRIAALEVEGATLNQTLELLHQEIASTSAKLNDKRSFYTETTEHMTVKLRDQQEWLGSLKNKITTRESLVATSNRKCNTIEGERHGMLSEDGVDQLESDVGNKQRELNIKVESTQLKIEDTKTKRTALLLEINKSKKILEKEKNIIAGFPAALQQMDMKSLEEEYKALQGDKAEEIQYSQSLYETIKGMKVISDPTKCPCGLEYKVELGGEAMDFS